MNYTKVYKALESAMAREVYVVRIQRDSSGQSLFVSFKTDAQRYYTAIFHGKTASITNGFQNARFDDAGQPVFRLEGTNYLAQNDAIIGPRGNKTAPGIAVVYIADGPYVLARKRGELNWQAVELFKPNHSVIEIDVAGVRPPVAAYGSDEFTVFWRVRTNGNYVQKFTIYGRDKDKGNFKQLEDIELPWVDDVWDMHAGSHDVLVTCTRGFIRRTCVYNLLTKQKRFYGFYNGENVLVTKEFKALFEHACDHPKEFHLTVSDGP